jgi:cytochrome c553
MRFARVRVHAFGLAALAAGLLLGGEVFAASAEKGKAAYIQHGCWACHGFQAQGGVTGPKLAPDPMAIEAFTAFHAYLETIPKPADYKSIPLLNQ